MDVDSDASGSTRGEKKEYYLNPIATPMASEKLTKRIYKVSKKCAKSKELKRGVTQVVKELRKKPRGICIIAGDVSPIEIICHLPILCENAGIPYIYIPSREELGLSTLTRRATSCVLLTPGKDSKVFSKYEKIREQILTDHPYMK
eukprot:CAMPEP_0114996580 /NCGR_PEP_ID=MMETSP0216-20121206/14401_1 /TAXON_ID=223996 /ORGANISM="Protocruzia adherens, Strain Boccale" /LENGTH=145 /DNA_ID=CAMNT_0002360823 /DNA_START=40 /DNA_END=477 /DNA_ORIENTATION=-